MYVISYLLHIKLTFFVHEKLTKWTIKSVKLCTVTLCTVKSNLIFQLKNLFLIRQLKKTLRTSSLEILTRNTLGSLSRFFSVPFPSDIFKSLCGLGLFDFFDQHHNKASGIRTQTRAKILEKKFCSKI